VGTNVVHSALGEAGKDQSAVGVRRGQTGANVLKMSVAQGVCHHLPPVSEERPRTTHRSGPVSTLLSRSKVLRDQGEISVWDEEEARSYRAVGVGFRIELVGAGVFALAIRNMSKDIGAVADGCSSVTCSPIS
jgi:hypothetical protein